MGTVCTVLRTTHTVLSDWSRSGTTWPILYLTLNTKQNTFCEEHYSYLGTSHEDQSLTRSQVERRHNVRDAIYACIYIKCTHRRSVSFHTKYLDDQDNNCSYTKSHLTEIRYSQWRKRKNHILLAQGIGHKYTRNNKLIHHLQEFFHLGNVRVTGQWCTDIWCSQLYMHVAERDVVNEYMPIDVSM